MFGFVILDVVMGLIFIFLLLSLLCSAVKEAFEAWMKKRATTLEKGIRVRLLCLSSAQIHSNLSWRQLKKKNL